MLRSTSATSCTRRQSVSIKFRSSVQHIDVGCVKNSKGFECSELLFAGEALAHPSHVPRRGAADGMRDCWLGKTLHSFSARLSAMLFVAPLQLVQGFFLLILGCSWFIVSVCRCRIRRLTRKRDSPREAHTCCSEHLARVQIKLQKCNHGHEAKYNPHFTQLASVGISVALPVRDVSQAVQQLLRHVAT